MLPNVGQGPQRTNVVSQRGYTQRCGLRVGELQGIVGHLGAGYRAGYSVTYRRYRARAGYSVTYRRYRARAGYSVTYRRYRARAGYSVTYRLYRARAGYSVIYRLYRARAGYSVIYRLYRARKGSRFPTLETERAVGGVLICDKGSTSPRGTRRPEQRNTSALLLSVLRTGRALLISCFNSKSGCKGAC